MAGLRFFPGQGVLCSSVPEGGSAADGSGGRTRRCSGNTSNGTPPADMPGKHDPFLLRERCCAGNFWIFQRSRPKISKRSPRNPEKALAHAVLTTEGLHPSEKNPGDHAPRVRPEHFSGQKFLVRNPVRPDFFAAKVFWPIFFRLEIFKIQNFSGRKLKNPKNSGAKVGKNDRAWCRLLPHRRKFPWAWWLAIPGNPDFFLP